MESRETFMPRQKTASSKTQNNHGLKPFPLLKTLVVWRPSFLVPTSFFVEDVSGMETFISSPYVILC